MSVPQNVVEMKDYRDPREQDVEEPLYVQALQGRVPASDICCADGCGQPRAAHYDASGCFMLGCEYAKQAASRPTWPRNPVNYGDPYPAVTLAVRQALTKDCGPALAAFLSTFAYDDLTGVAHQIGKGAIAAYLKEIAK